MSWIHAARARVALLLSRKATDSRFSEEIGFHIEMETDRLQREEMLDRTEARRRALIAFGGVEHHKEALRDGRGLRWLGGLQLDLKLGVRMLVKWPGLTLVGVLGMAVAVAIGAVSYGIIYTFVGTTVPIDEGDRVVMIENFDRRRNRERQDTHLHDMRAWRTSLPALEEVAAYRMTDRNLIARGTRPEPVRVAEMTASGFRIARTAPALGRYLRDEDEAPGAPAVAVIGHDIWQNRFAGERNIIGRTIQLGATPHTIVGVMPPGFAFPVNNRVWTALRLDPLAFAGREAPAMNVFGRLAPGATLADAEVQLTAIAQRHAADDPSRKDVGTGVLPYALAFFDSPSMAWAMHIVQFVVSLLLVVIGINVATLVYARTVSRTGEIAIRTALGASRKRIVAQLFAEAFVLTATSAAIGLFGASIALRYIRAYVGTMGGEQLPYWMHFDVSPGMIVYVLVMALLAALLVGVIPALKATRRAVHTSLQQIGAGGGGVRLGRTWTVLIVAQVAVAVALLPVVGQAAFVQRPRNAVQGPTFVTSDWVTASLHLDRDDVAQAAAGDERAHLTRYAMLSAEVVRQLRAEPAITDVVLLSGVPGSEPQQLVEADSAPVASEAVPTREGPTGVHPVGTAVVDANFFRAFGIPVLTGRSLQPGDASSAMKAVVVNTSFVRQVLGGGNALGRRVREAGEREAGQERPGGPWYEIVGVVPDFPSAAPLSAPRPTVYHAMAPESLPAVTVAVRVKGAAPVSLSQRLRDVSVSVDPMLRLSEIRPLDETLSIERMADRVIFVAVYLVTGSVLLLSAAGIYALMSFTIAHRRREIGVRSALGAGPRQVLVTVLSRAARQIGAGIAIGIVVGGAMVQGMQGATNDLRSFLVLAAFAAFMGIVGVAAAWGPARVALRIQPTEALRAD